MLRALDSECSYNLLGVIGCVVTDFSVPTCFALSAMNRRGWESLAENHQRWFSLSTISISCWIVEARGHRIWKDWKHHGIIANQASFALQSLGSIVFS